MESLFSDIFLAKYIDDFSPSSITGIREIKSWISDFAKEITSFKLGSLKEEEVKSRFINGFFGDALKFNYGNTNEWLLREEAKTKIDGKKPDAALGYFMKDKTKDDVRAVIEIKDANSNLDEKQKRQKNQQTPVEQAFSYSHKMRGNCKWVIVSNMKEIRFYSSNDSTKYQQYLIEELTEDHKLKELIFLFHKDRLLKKEGDSKTDILYKISKSLRQKNETPNHIIDKLHSSITRFEGLGFVDPNYIASISPFNILDEYVWHYEDGTLFTLNNSIYSLLKSIKVKDNEILISEELRLEIDTVKVVDAMVKIKKVFAFLNTCMISKIIAIKDYKEFSSRKGNAINFTHRHIFRFSQKDDGVVRNINISKQDNCECVICNYENLDIKKFRLGLKGSLEEHSQYTLEQAYANYLVGTENFSKSYAIYKRISELIKGKEGKEIEYFLCQMNIKNLHNLIRNKQEEEDPQILKDIRAIDLNKVIYDEIEYSIDIDVKNYLIDIKEDTLIFKMQDQIEKALEGVNRLQVIYEDDQSEYNGPNWVYILINSYLFLYCHVNLNNIIYSVFTRYSQLTEKFFKGLIISHKTKRIGLIEFNEFFLTQAILYIDSSSLKNIIEPLDKIKCNNECIIAIINKLTNLTTSYCQDGIFGYLAVDPILVEHLSSFRNKIKFQNIFSNLLIIIEKLEVSKEHFFKALESLIPFLKIETTLATYNIRQLSELIFEKPHLFSLEVLVKILSISLERGKYSANKYPDVIESVSITISKSYPEFKFPHLTLVSIAIANSTDYIKNRTSLKHLIPILNILNIECKNLLTSAFESTLDNEFIGDFYESLIEKAGYDYTKKDYFLKYVSYIENNRKRDVFKFGTRGFTDLVFIHYAIILYKLDIDFAMIENKILTNLNNFETWLLNPVTYNYDLFEPEWLIDLQDQIFMDKLKVIVNIKNKVVEALNKSYNPELYKIQYLFFNEVT